MRMRCSVIEQRDSLIFRRGSAGFIIPRVLVCLVFCLLCACSRHGGNAVIGNTGHAVFDASNSGLDSVTVEVGSLGTVEALDLGGNNISTLPKEIWQLNNLRRLDLSWNQIREIPSEISKLTSLEELKLSGNPIDSLPREMGALKNLKKLELSWTNISSLPRSFNELKNLRELKLYDVPVRDEDSIKLLFPDIDVSFDFFFPTEANRYYFEKGIRFHKLDRFNPALKYYSMALDHDPNFFLAYRFRGSLKFNSNDKQGGCDDWRNAAVLGDTAAAALLQQYCR
jgi:hypothetical protein